MREAAYFRALQTVLHGTGLPYGYAITVWSTGSTVTAARGMPSVPNIFLFALGATIAYGGLMLLTWETQEEAERPITHSPNRVRAGLIHVAAIGSAIAAAYLVSQIDSDVVWPLASLAATLTYLGVSSVEIALVERSSGDGATGS
ncbi:MAG: hypothetical protein M3301_06470 [Chloroflexota bacterium]|nr:hypothetical protein [Chloroflexota bacterium]